MARTVTRRNSITGKKLIAQWRDSYAEGGYGYIHGNTVAELLKTIKGRLEKDPNSVKDFTISRTSSGAKNLGWGDVESEEGYFKFLSQRTGKEKVVKFKTPGHWKVVLHDLSADYRESKPVKTFDTYQKAAKWLREYEGDLRLSGVPHRMNRKQNPIGIMGARKLLRNARKRKPSGKLRDMERPEVLGYELDRETLTPKRRRVDLDTPGDWGADPVGEDPSTGVFMFRMVPSGDIVDGPEKERRLKGRRAGNPYNRADAWRYGVEQAEKDIAAGRKKGPRELARWYHTHGSSTYGRLDEWWDVYRRAYFKTWDVGPERTRAGGRRNNPSSVEMEGHDWIGPFKTKREAKEYWVSGMPGRNDKAIYKKKGTRWFYRPAERGDWRTESGGWVSNPSPLNWYEMGYTVGEQERRALDVMIPTDPDIKSGERFEFLWSRAVSNGEERTRDYSKRRSEFMRGFYDAWTRRSRTPKRRGTRRNPNNPTEFQESDRLYKDFHGKPPTQTTEVRTVVSSRSDLAELGDLAEMDVHLMTDEKVRIQFPINGRGTILLCSSPDGRQLYLEGGNQTVDLRQLGMSGRDWVRDQMCLGVVLMVTYRTEKGFDKFQLTDYFHKLGEVTGQRPVLNYDTINHLLTISGGQYEVRPEGIVN